MAVQVVCTKYALDLYAGRKEEWHFVGPNQYGPWPARLCLLRAVQTGHLNRGQSVARRSVPPMAAGFLEYAGRQNLPAILQDVGRPGGCSLEDICPWEKNGDYIKG